MPHPRSTVTTAPRTLLPVVIAGMALPLVAQEDFCQSPLGVSHLLTPGTATCEVVDQSTTVTLFDNTIISWDTIALLSNRRLEFAFANPQHTVVNQSRGTAVFPNGVTQPTYIGGTLVSNGNVVILSPDNWLQFTNDARVEVGSLTASGLGGESAQFFSNEGEIELNATPLTDPTTLIRGEITTTTGDLIVVGKQLAVTSKIDSAGSVTAVTGSHVRLTRSGRRVIEASGGTQILQGGPIRARGDIELVSQNAINMAGEFTPGDGRGRVFARVDDNGELQIGPAGLTIRGTAEFSKPTIGEIAFIDPDEGDNPGTRSPAVNDFPVLGEKKIATRARPTSSSITARAPSSFTRPTATTAKRKRPASTAKSAISGVAKLSLFRRRASSTSRGAERARSPE